MSLSCVRRALLGVAAPLLFWGRSAEGSGSLPGLRLRGAKDSADRRQLSSQNIKSNDAGEDWLTDGVNLGSWLHLEDWFFSGSHGRFVSTPNDEPGAGLCLPPLLNELEVPWRSEGGLVHYLNSTQGTQSTVDIFKAHRESFVQREDLQKMKDLGLTFVRVPLNWAAFADAIIGVDDEAYRSHNPDQDTVLVPDPFYSSEIALATVPRNLLASFLRNCSALGLGVVLDMHALPGGSSHGTFNAITPLRPVFWEESVELKSQGDGSRRNLTDVGLQVVEGMVQWVRNLDAEAQGAIVGLTMMNEPALFVRPYVTEKILAWSNASAAPLRQARAEGVLQHVKLYVNLHEAAFENFERDVAPWWHSAFSAEERYSWVVFDLHYYVAWNPWCTGSIDGDTVWGPARFKCDDDTDVVQQVFDDCVEGWASNFASMFEGLKASTETSAGTWFDTSVACTNPGVTNALGRALSNKMRAQNISSFFWSWRMPYGRSYEAGWSLAYLKGLNTEAQEHECRPARRAQALIDV